MLRLLCFVLPLIGWMASPACAQSFGPPVLTDRVLVLLDREGNVRFTFGTYFARWENPFQVAVSTYSSREQGYLNGTFHLRASTPTSPLFEGNYRLSRHWSVGLWHNPIRGERLRQQVHLFGKIDRKGKDVDLDFERDTDLGDLHVVYAGPRGLSAQLGYYREHGTVRDNTTQPLSKKDYTLVSWNIWLTQRLDVFLQRRLTSDRLTTRFVPFLSFGYHPSSDLRHAASLLAGVAATFRDRISLSGSMWLFELNGSTSTRITGGLVIQL